MELALRRSYGFAFAPPLNRWGLRGLGDCDASDVDPETGLCLDGSVYSGGAGGLVTDESGNTCAASAFVNGQCPASLVASTVAGAGASAGSSSGSPTSSAPLVSTYQITDATGVIWNCDTNGNCCNPSMTCQQGPPTIVTTIPPNATAAQNASGSTANQSTAALVAALATAAAAAGKAVVGVPGSIQCSAGVAVPAGTKCPGATGTSVCPAGSTLSGTTCSASIIPGLSNSTLMIGVVIFAAVMLMSGKKGR